MQSMVTDLLEKEKTAILSDSPIPGMTEGVTQVIMEGVHLDHKQSVWSVYDYLQGDWL